MRVCVFVCERPCVLTLQCVGTVGRGACRLRREPPAPPSLKLSQLMEWFHVSAAKCSYLSRCDSPAQHALSPPKNYSSVASINFYRPLG